MLPFLIHKVDTALTLLVSKIPQYGVNFIQEPLEVPFLVPVYSLQIRISNFAAGKIARLALHTIPYGSNFTFSPTQLQETFTFLSFY